MTSFCFSADYIIVLVLLSLHLSDMSVGGPSVTNIDPRLWAYLRILYAKKEGDLTKHGYTPFTLQNAGSMLSADIEAEVIKTLVGISGVILRIYGSSMKVCGTVWCCVV
jgi:hypothetical protein